MSSDLDDLVARYLRWFRVEWGATPRTLRDYKAILERMARTIEKDPTAVEVEDLRAVIDLWGEKSARTRQKVSSVIKAFWSWCELEGHIAVNPAGRLRRPKAERKVVRTLPTDARERMLAAAGSPRDRLGLLCLFDLGLRRDELAGVRARDIDIKSKRIRVLGKGQKERTLPLRGAILDEARLYFSADLPHLARPPHGDDYLLYPIRTLVLGRGSEGQAKREFRAEPKSKPSEATMHRFWYRIAQEAELVAPGVMSGFNMHRARHSFAQAMRRADGLDSASRALGHSDVSTTLGVYGHYEESDLEAAFDRLNEDR